MIIVPAMLSESEFDRLARETIYTKDQWVKAWCYVRENFPVRSVNIVWEVVVKLAPMGNPLTHAEQLKQALRG